MNTGSCLCGTIRWRMEPPHIRMSHCHCSMCRKAHAAPFATYLVVAPKQFGFTTGEGMVAAYASSPGFTRQFCFLCGSVVTAPRPNGAVAVPAGCLDDDPGFRPERHIFATKAPAWHTIAGDLPRFNDYGRVAAPPTIDKPSRASGQPGLLRGSCLCGACIYETTGPLIVEHNCHCSRCRKARAAAHTTNGLVARENIEYRRGDDFLEWYKVPEAQFFNQAFCRVFGSGLPHIDSSRSCIAIPLGSLDDEPERGAADYIYCASKAPWYEIVDDLPQHDERPG